MNKVKKLQNDQRGLVSFLVTMILMAVITLIVIGFTQLVIRNRQDALDRQLSTQAFYAAETAVNDAYKRLKALYAANASNLSYTPPTKSTCDSSGTSAYNPVSPATTTLAPGVKYTCLLVTPNSRWVQTSASVSSSKIIPVDPVDSNGNPVAIWSLKFEWKPTLAGAYTSCPSTPTTYPRDWGDCPYGLLRIDLLDTKKITANNADAYRDATHSIYMMPVSNAGFNLVDISNPGGLRAWKARANCTATSCAGQIDIHADPANVPYKYYVRLSSMYLDIPSITMTGQQNDGWVYPGFSFKGQTRIDATGKAQDVLRRVQVQVSAENFDNSLLPNAAVHSAGDVCKRFIAAPGYEDQQCSL